MSSRRVPAAPTTPISTPKQRASVTAATESPGNWSHPRLAEITRRRNATTFTDKNVRIIIYNVLALAAVLFVNSNTSVQKYILKYSASTRSYISWTVFLAVACIISNIAAACLPLFRAADPVEDIPLTAAQRKLLGLPPSSAPPTPGSVFSTPPRYSRTPSISGSVGSAKSFGTSSPLSGKGSPVPANASRRMSGSPFSPNGGGGSPLLHKAMSGNSGRRSSFGSPGPLPTNGNGSGLFDSPMGTPSPSNKRTSVGLNSKWLYEKGRRSSGSTWVH